jgi:hypothetical protein
MSYAELDEKSLMLGGHEARLIALEKQAAETGADVKKILAFVERSKGSWKTLVGLGTLVAGLVEAGHWVVQLFGSGTHGTH